MGWTVNIDKIALPEWLAYMTELVNIAKVHMHWWLLIDSYSGIWM
jgi:hypothetical protein